MAHNPKFHSLLDKMAKMHDRKNHDYARSGNPYSNFEEAAAFAATDVDTVFKVMLGIKMARLNELQGAGKTPQNESVQDSMLDLSVYAALWASYYEPAQVADATSLPATTTASASKRDTAPATSVSPGASALRKVSSGVVPPA